MFTKAMLALSAASLAVVPSAASAHGWRHHRGAYAYGYPSYGYYPRSSTVVSIGYGGYGGYGYPGYGYSGYGYGYPSYGYGYPAYGYSNYGYGYPAYGYSNYGYGYDRYQCSGNTVAGAAIGGIAGAAIGSAAGENRYRYSHRGYRYNRGNNGALVGAVAGAILGGVVGSSSC